MIFNNNSTRGHTGSLLVLHTRTNKFIFASHAYLQSSVFIFILLYDDIGPGCEYLSGQWSVWCSHLLRIMQWIYKKKKYCSNKKYIIIYI